MPLEELCEESRGEILQPEGGAELKYGFLGGALCLYRYNYDIVAHANKHGLFLKKQNWGCSALSPNSAIVLRDYLIEASKLWEHINQPQFKRRK